MKNSVIFSFGILYDSFLFTIAIVHNHNEMKKQSTKKTHNLY